MATVELIDGRIIENAHLTDVESVGEEGSKRAIAHIDGKSYHVYNSIVDGFNNIWYEQISLEAFRQLDKRAELYNREMDECNRIIAENRDKPWLPLHDGE